MKISWNETCSLLAYCVCAHVQVQYTIFDETFSRANFSIHILSAIVSIRPVCSYAFFFRKIKKKSEIKFESLFEWTSIRNTHKKKHDIKNSNTCVCSVERKKICHTKSGKLLKLVTAEQRIL